MNNSLLNLNVGIVSFMAYPQIIKGEGPIVESLIKILKDPFFSLIEITHIKDTSERKKLKSLIEISNIKVSFGAQPFQLMNKLNLNSQDISDKKNAISKLNELLDEAYDMGCISFALLSGQDPKVGLERKKETDILINSLKEVCAYNNELSIKYGKAPIPIVLEVFDSVSYGKNRLIGSTSLSVEVVKEVKKDFLYFGLMLDLSHIPLLSENYKESIILAKNYLSHIHIGNCIKKDPSHIAYGDEHPRFCIECGEVFIEDVAGFLSVLNDIGYINKKDKYISFEVKPLPGEDPDLVIAGSKRDRK
ncbi:MAG: sugar phosphate isomerase/epimerase, partial [Actinobacteria bacterium]|nr:sugar phosphate isomerase/epimerase [Actinomycetota bacterium]